MKKIKQYEEGEIHVNNPEFAHEELEEKKRHRKWLWLILLLLMCTPLVSFWGFSYYSDNIRNQQGSSVDDNIDQPGNNNSNGNNNDPVVENPPIINTDTLKIVFAEDSVITLTNAAPMPDEVGLSLTDSGLSQFTITNEGNLDVTYDIVLEKVTDKTTIDASLLNYALVSKGQVAKTTDIKRLSNNNQVSLLSGQTLGGAKSVSFDLRLWVDKRVTVDNGQQKTYSGRIVVNVNSNAQGGAGLSE